MARRLIIGVMLASVTAVSAAGCGGSDNKSKKDGPEVAWAGKVCDSVGQRSAQLQLPQVNSKDSKSLKTGYYRFLGNLSAQLKALEGSLQGAGAPPVSGGPATLTKATTNLKAAQTAVDGAQAELGKAKTTNIKVFQASLAKVGQTMAKFSGYEGPVKDLRTNPALSVAFDKAPSCSSRKL